MLAANAHDLRAGARVHCLTRIFLQLAAVSTLRQCSVHAAISSALVLSAACSGDPTGIELDAVFQRTFTDPVGDTIAPGANVFARALDVKTIRVGMTAESLFVRYEFTQPIAFWSTGGPESIDGFVDLDLDDNAATGGRSAVDEFGYGAANMGADYYVSLRDDRFGHVRMRDFASRTWHTLGITIAGNGFTLRMQRGVIGEADGVLSISALVGGQLRLATDAVPNQGHFRIAIP